MNIGTFKGMDDCRGPLTPYPLSTSKLSCSRQFGVAGRNIVSVCFGRCAWRLHST